MGEGKDIALRGMSVQGPEAMAEGLREMLGIFLDNGGIKVQYGGVPLDIHTFDRYGQLFHLKGEHDETDYTFRFKPRRWSVRSQAELPYMVVDVEDVSIEPFVLGDNNLLICLRDMHVEDRIPNSRLQEVAELEKAVAESMAERYQEQLTPALSLDFEEGIAYFTLWYEPGFRPDIDTIRHIEAGIMRHLKGYQNMRFYEFCEDDFGLEFEIEMKNGRTDIP